MYAYVQELTKMKKTKLGIISTAVFSAGVATGALLPAKSVKVFYHNQIRHDLETSEKVKDIIGDNKQCNRKLAENGKGEKIYLAFCTDNIFGEDESKILDNLINSKDSRTEWTSISLEKVLDGQGHERTQVIANYDGFVSDKVSNLEAGKQALIVP
jgi:hypothetical protein